MIALVALLTGCGGGVAGDDGTGNGGLQAGSTPLIANGGFAQGLQGWRPQNANSNLAAVGDVSGSSGSSFAKVKGDDPDGPLGIALDGPLVSHAYAGQDYTVTARVRAQNGLPAPIQVFIAEQNADGQQIGVSQAEADRRDGWQEVSVTRTAAQTGGRLALSIRATKAAKGSISVDDVTLRALAPSPNLIGNPSFEGGANGWTAAGQGSALETVEDPVAPLGRSALIARRGDSGPYGLLSPTMATGASGSYQASAWLRSEGEAGEPAVVTLEELSGDEVVASSSVELKLAPDLYRPVTVAHEIAQEGSALRMRVERPDGLGDALLADAVALGSCNPNLDELRIEGCSADRRDRGIEAFTEAEPHTWGSVDCENSPADLGEDLPGEVPGSRVANLDGAGSPAPLADGSAPWERSFRRLNLYDSDDFDGARCEIGRNELRNGEKLIGSGEDSAFVLIDEGERRVLFLSLRLSPGLQLDRDTWQLFLQLKHTNPTDYVAEEGRDAGPVFAIQVRQRPEDDVPMWLVDWVDPATPNTSRFVWSAPAQTGRWVRFAFDLTASQDPAIGSFGVYVDLNGDGDTTDPGEQSLPGDPAGDGRAPNPLNGATLRTESEPFRIDDGPAAGEPIPLHLRLGPYMDPELPCPEPGERPGPGCFVDIDSVEVVRLDDGGP